MPGFRFIVAMILALYAGFFRLNHLQFLEREPISRKAADPGVIDGVLLQPACARPGHFIARRKGTSFRLRSRPGPRILPTRLWQWSATEATASTQPVDCADLKKAGADTKRPRLQDSPVFQ